MSKFIISKRINGEYQFRLINDNGMTLLSSEGYYKKEACINGIKSTKINGIIPERFDKKKSTNNKFYFLLKGKNGQIICYSDLYEVETIRDIEIDIVQKILSEKIEIEDLTY